MRRKKCRNGFRGFFLLPGGGNIRYPVPLLNTIIAKLRMVSAVKHNFGCILPTLLRVLRQHTGRTIIGAIDVKQRKTIRMQIPCRIAGKHDQAIIRIEMF